MASFLSLSFLFPSLNTDLDRNHPPIGKRPLMARRNMGARLAFPFLRLLGCCDSFGRSAVFPGSSAVRNSNLFFFKFPDAMKKKKKSAFLSQLRGKQSSFDTATWFNLPIRVMSLCAGSGFKAKWIEGYKRLRKKKSGRHERVKA